MATGDLIKLGTVYVREKYLNEKPIKRPSYPWDNGYDPFYNGKYIGDVKDVNTDVIIDLRESTNETDESFLVYWREVNVGSKKLLIADRNLIRGYLDDFKKNSLNSKIITLYGQKYMLRFLSIDEWVAIICNKGNYPNLPTPTNDDTSPKFDPLRLYKYQGVHNQFWNWFRLSSFIGPYKDVFYGAGYDSTENYWEKVDNSLKGWRPVLEVLNEPPTISDVDRNLGDKNDTFSILYQVNDANNDSLTIAEKLNGNTLRTLNNAPKGQDLTINISREQLYALPLNTENKITIEVNDGKGGVSYRNYSFRRTNTAPIISNSDKNLGVITALTEKYTINDMEGNAVTIVEKLDNVVLRNFAAVLGKEYTTTIDKDTWIKLKNGPHTYSIEATDSNNSKSTRVFSFTKKETRIDFTLSKPFTTDIKASKILVTPSWELNGATAKIEVCNNGFDVNPTWEDITKQVLINRHYNFTNTAKTADKWGVNIRIYIEKDPASLADVSIKGFGGAFE